MQLHDYAYTNPLCRDAVLIVSAWILLQTELFQGHGLPRSHYYSFVQHTPQQSHLKGRMNTIELLHKDYKQNQYKKT